MQPQDPQLVEEFYELTEHPEAVPVIWHELENGWTADTVFDIWGPLFPLGIFIGLLCLAGVTYCVLRIWQIRQAEWASFGKAAATVYAEDIPRTHLRWRRVMEHANSDDEHKWRLAILEADIMLNELLDLQGFKGETMGDKMKQVNRTQFNTIDDAWEAHRARNKIAHEGTEVPLSERDKNAIMTMYERVFREFEFI